MNIFHNINKRPLEYLTLFFILLIALILFITFSYDHFVQRRIIYAASAAYFCWSLYHHYRRGDLHLSIVIEYLLFILLAIIITGFTLI